MREREGVMVIESGSAQEGERYVDRVCERPLEKREYECER